MDGSVTTTPVAVSAAEALGCEGLYIAFLQRKLLLAVDKVILDKEQGKHHPQFFVA